MYTKKIELTKEENVIIENLLILLSSLIPENVRLGIQLAQNHLSILDRLFVGGFSAFERNYEKLLEKELKWNDPEDQMDINFCYWSFKQTADIVII